MKKPKLSLPVVLTFAFTVFLAGLFLGRVLYRGDVIVSTLPPGSRSTPLTQSTQPSAAPASVNINTADARELSRLPGIGEVLAERIVDYRNTHGPFSAPEELLKVSGIGASTLEAILDSVTTGG